MNCILCKKLLTGQQEKYCCVECQRAHKKQEFDRLNPQKTQNYSVRGKIPELHVCVDLLKKNFEVFENVCGTGWCDFLVYKENNYFLVEVTSGYILTTKRINNKSHIKQEKRKWDVLAIYYPDGKIEYIPNNIDLKKMKLFEKQEEGEDEIR